MFHTLPSCFLSKFFSAKAWVRFGEGLSIAGKNYFRSSSSCESSGRPKHARLHHSLELLLDVGNINISMIEERSSKINASKNIE